jgi:cation transporter-like permease
LILVNWKEEEFRKILKEFLLTLVLSAFIVNLTGIFLTKVNMIFSERREFYLIYPALTTTIGAIGSIIGSTATTKLALGTMNPNLSSFKTHIYQIGIAWLSSLILFIINAAIASWINELTLPQILAFLRQILITNVLAVVITSFFTVIFSITVYRRGLDPDNFVIPIESALADTITTFSLLLTLTMIP